VTRSPLADGLALVRRAAVHARQRIQIAIASLPTGAASARVRERWAPHEAADVAQWLWTQSRIVREYLHERVSGNPACDWVTWMLYRHAPVGKAGGQPRLLSALVLGCGDGWLERRLAGDERFGRVVGVDVANGVVEEAQRAAEAAGLGSRISHAVVDLDRDPLPAGPWDLVLSHDVIHHVRDLEGLY